MAKAKAKAKAKANKISTIRIFWCTFD